MKLIAALALGLLSLSSQAQVLAEPELERLRVAERFDELQRLAATRVAAHADDAQAVLALAVAALQGEAAAPRQAAIAAAEACLQRVPKAAPCHWALGSTLGVQAMSEGLMAMAGSAGRVKTELQEALALAPAWWPARSAMVDFYLLAPGLMGGSRSKALELAGAAPRPEQAQALQARVALYDKQPERALTLLSAVNAGTDGGLDEDLRQWAASAAFALLGEGQPAPGRNWFERALRERPADALPAYGLARVLAETGAPAEALPLYERASRGKGAAGLPIAYRQGLALQALGQNDAARAAFQRFVGAGKGPKKSLADARERLAALGG
jgi:tetratricopeptide (TPR) repeat protein